MFFCAFFLPFPRILGVPRREKPLLFCGVSLALFLVAKKSKGWRIREKINGSKVRVNRQKIACQGLRVAIGPNPPTWGTQMWNGRGKLPVLVAHDCGYPLSRYTRRATRVAAYFLDFIAFCRCSSGVAPHPPKILVSHLSPPLFPGGVAPKFGSEKVSRYTGVSQVQLRVSRYTVQLSFQCGWAMPTSNRKKFGMTREMGKV